MLVTLLVLLVFLRIVNWAAHAVSGRCSYSSPPLFWAFATSQAVVIGVVHLLSLTVLVFGSIHNLRGVWTLHPLDGVVRSWISDGSWCCWRIRRLSGLQLTNRASVVWVRYFGTYHLPVGLVPGLQGVLGCHLGGRVTYQAVDAQRFHERKTQEQQPSFIVQQD